MADIDRIIEELLGDRRIAESATFSTQTFADQPLIERASSLQERLERLRSEREARRAGEARQQARQGSGELDGSEQQRLERRRSEREARRAGEARQGSGELDGSTQQRLEQLRSWQQTSAASVSPQPSFPLPPAPRKMGRLPDRIREMRKLEHGKVSHSFSYGSGVAAQLFLRQARLMEDYEDSYEFVGTFSQYYPTYASMSDYQLRGYFSWRTRVRAGSVVPAPLSFAFVYLYELLMGVGTTPGRQAYQDIKSFVGAWREQVAAGTTTPLDGYARRWLRDYAIYHGLEEELRADTTRQQGTQVVVLMRAEHAQLAADGRKPRIPNTALREEAPSAHELFEALGDCASYHINTSRLAKTERELLEAVTADVFAALVKHCSRRRKTDFVEGLFGYAHAYYYTMFAGAVFCEEEPHPDVTVRVSDYESYTCKDGYWRMQLACESHDRSKELGAILHDVDYELRRQLDYPYPLKHKPVPKYVHKLVSEAIATRLAERAEAERRRITIDRSQLAGIRAASALTQEALLTDEERGELPTMELGIPAPAVPAPSDAPAPGEQADASESTGRVTPAPATGRTATPGAADSGGVPTQAGPEPVASAAHAQDGISQSSPLPPLETRVLQGLLAGTPVTELLGPTDPFVSVVADSINEAFFDLVGDAVIEFDGDEPHIVEDYLEDVREVLQS